ncbi:hypothetical protein BZB76_3747 [Actinomadura pelletieri DSM 43383]|uniref:Neocarzinostatin family protein n=1 Tax=Actinomadura pelletieri DSM 43383 TaxID=1120940 RepID=A0A495QKP2_9ACTN|nr:hypothetical protein [Actinomadura pelletieri]RKS73063.1 hypothetical protein BZB76_3747 [Actinomadura pelletieri DSM 43383]
MPVTRPYVKHSHVKHTAARPAAALALTVAACLAGGGAFAPAAYADPGKATGPAGQTMTVSKVDGLPEKGATVRVTGSGFDTSKGIYIGLCKDNGAGKPPGPCGGGADTSGKAGASQWISSNPPPYGKGLTVPYGPGGTFDVTIRVGAALDKSVDCAEVRCVVAARTDHTRRGDRSQDVLVPVKFGEDGGVPVWVWAVAGVGVLVVVGGAVLVLRRRRAPAGAAA